MSLLNGPEDKIHQREEHFYTGDLDIKFPNGHGLFVDGVRLVPAGEAPAISNRFPMEISKAKAQNVNVLFLGDSNTEGAGAAADDRWIDETIECIRRDLGLPVGGRGYIPAWYNYGSHAGPQFAEVGTRTASTRGLGQRARVMNNTGGVNTSTITVSCDVFDVVYTKAPSAGNLSVVVDGGAPVIIACADAVARSGYKQRFSPGAGNHTIVVSYSSGLVPIFEGIAFYNGDSAAGPILWDGSKSGTWSVTFAGSLTWAESLQAADPDIVILAHGVNDYRMNIVPATYQANLTTIINTVRATNFPNGTPINPTVPVLLVHFPKPLDLVGAYHYDEYRFAMENVAKSLTNVSVLNLDNKLDFTIANGVSSDLLHPNASGHRLIGRIMADVLLGRLVV